MATDTLDDWLEEWPTRKGPATEEEVQRLVDEIERLHAEVAAHEVARMPEGNETRCRRCLPSVGVRVQCEDCRRIDKRAAEIRAGDA